MISGRVVGLSPRPLAPTVGLDPVLQLGGSGLEQRASRVPGAGGVGGEDLPTSLLLCAGPEARLHGALCLGTI